MKYIAPLNNPATVEIPRPPYINGNVAAGLEGSFPPAESFEHPQREILAVIEGAGLTPTSTDLTQLKQAIDILAAGAGASSAVFIYNPVFPQVTVGGGVMSIAGSNGQIVLADGQTFIHRGGVLYNTNSFDLAARTFPLVASKTYHLRWRYNGGAPTLSCIDLSDGTYNPGVLAETDPGFDTTYDDMLIARVVTDASNDPTITALVNLDSIEKEHVSSGPATTIAEQGAQYQAVFDLNWSRTPIATLTATAGQSAGSRVNGYANLISGKVVTRYSVSAYVTTDFDIAPTSPWGEVLLQATAKR